MWTLFNARFRALGGVAGACALALLAASCGRESGAGGEQAGGGSANPITPELAIDAVPQEEPGVARTLWRASNQTALQSTGNLRVSLEGVRGGPIIFAFATGVTVRAQPIDVSPAANRSGVANYSYASLLGADPRVDVHLYRVLDETVTPSAPRGGLCGPARARFLAVSEFVDQRERWVLRAAAFRGSTPPGLAGASPLYCGVFTFEAP